MAIDGINSYNPFLNPLNSNYGNVGSLRTGQYTPQTQQVRPQQQVTPAYTEVQGGILPADRYEAAQAFIDSGIDFEALASEINAATNPFVTSAQVGNEKIPVGKYNGTGELQPDSRDAEHGQKLWQMC